MFEQVLDFEIDRRTTIDDLARLYLNALQSSTRTSDFVSGFIFQLGVVAIGSPLFREAVERMTPLMSVRQGRLEVHWPFERPVIDIFATIEANIDQVPLNGAVTHWSRLAQLVFL